MIPPALFIACRRSRSRTASQRSSRPAETRPAASLSACTLAKNKGRQPGSAAASGSGNRGGPAAVTSHSNTMDEPHHRSSTGTRRNTKASPGPTATCRRSRNSGTKNALGTQRPNTRARLASGSPCGESASGSKNRQEVPDQRAVYSPSVILCHRRDVADKARLFRTSTSKLRAVLTFDMDCRMTLQWPNRRDSARHPGPADPPDARMRPPPRSRHRDPHEQVTRGVFVVGPGPLSRRSTGSRKKVGLKARWTESE